MCHPRQIDGSVAYEFCNTSIAECKPLFPKPYSRVQDDQITKLWQLFSPPRLSELRRAFAVKAGAVYYYVLLALADWLEKFKLEM